MSASENRPNEGTLKEGVNAFASGTKDVGVEIRTASERIEGFIKIPAEAQNYCKRLSDILWYADRGGTGILTVANASVYDLKTSKLITRQPLLGVAKSQVTYFWLLGGDSASETQIVEISERG
ncbi:MAG: hypothetical protein HY547_07960 [Elusimicrobia bacterium]|nr:hypothetical protein [Elusimicrobiota bacterium]